MVDNDIDPTAEDVTDVDVLVTGAFDNMSKALDVGFITSNVELLIITAGMMPLTGLPIGVIKSLLTAQAVNVYSSESFSLSNGTSTTLPPSTVGAA